MADQAASVVTLGAAEAAEAAVPLIVEGAGALVRSLAADLEQYVVGMVVMAAARPLFTRVEEALAGLDRSKSGTAAGTPTGFVLDPAAIHAQTAALRGHASALHASALHTHAAAFQQAVRALGF